jgi:protein-disulfide isomerase
MLFIFKFFLFYLLVFSVFADDGNKSNSQIELLIEEYILKNPEVIIKSLENYRSLQEAKIEEEQKFLINNYYAEKIYDSLPASGNAAGSIIVTEFIDYNCGYCKKNHEIMMNILNVNNDIKYIIKELPILGESSLLASKFAIIIYFVDGPKIYEKFYDSLMKHNSQLNFEVLNRIANKVGSSVIDFNSRLNTDRVNNVILKNLTLADKLSIDGTPTFIIEDNIFRGFISFDQLQEIIDNFRKKK